jgi:hypothetical protein
MFNSVFMITIEAKIFQREHVGLFLFTYKQQRDLNEEKKKTFPLNKLQ